MNTVNNITKLIQAMQRLQGTHVYERRGAFQPFNHSIHLTNNTILYFFNKKGRALIVQSGWPGRKKQSSKKHLRKLIAHIITTGEIPK